MSEKEARAFLSRLTHEERVLIYQLIQTIVAQRDTKSQKFSSAS